MIKMHIALLVSFLSFAISANATDFSGTFSSQNNQYYLQTDSGLRQMTAGNPRAKEDLSKLQDGDFLTVAGSIGSVDQTMISVDSVNFVGLIKLIGTWLSSQQAVFDFSSFTEVSLYQMQNDVSNAADLLANLIMMDWDRPLGQPPQMQTLHYTIAPDKGKSWSIFFSSAQNVELASIEFKGDISSPLLTINFFDSTTGRVVTSLNLSRIGSW